jgi:hypothetical protein
MTAPDDRCLAVMEDDTVLCSDCLDELHTEQAVDTAATIVHAWLAEPACQACRCCGATDRDTGR